MRTGGQDDNCRGSAWIILHSVMQVGWSLDSVSCLSEQADYRIMAHYLPPLHKALFQMHILVQFPSGPKYNNHVPCNIIEPTSVEHHTSDRRPDLGPFLSEDIHTTMRRTVHATCPRMPPERLMVIAVRSPARHLIPLRNNQNNHKQRCGSDNDIFDPLFHSV